MIESCESHTGPPVHPGGYFCNFVAKIMDREDLFDKNEIIKIKKNIYQQINVCI